MAYPFDDPFTEAEAVDAVAPRGYLPNMRQSSYVWGNPEPNGDSYNEFMHSPGLAMASRAMNNMFALRRGQVPRATPVFAAQEAQRQNQELNLRRARILDARRQMNQRMAIAAAEEARRADPFWEYEQFRERYPEQAEGMTFQDFQNIGLRAATAPADVQTYLFRESLSPEQRVEFDKQRRAGNIINLPGGGVGYRDASGQLVTLVSPEAAIAGAAGKREAETTAAGEATAELDEAERQRVNQRTWDAYNVGMERFADAMGGTWTGSFVGLAPAITAAQKTAEGASALMLPILKNIFRESGEGTFTEGDQLMMMRMLPGRNDPPETVQFKLETLDAVVRSRLGIPDDVNTDDLPDD